MKDVPVVVLQSNCLKVLICYYEKLGSVGAACL